MRKHKYIAWVLVLSLLFSVFCPGMAVTYAEGANSEPAGYAAKEVVQDLAGAGSADVVAAEQPIIHIDGVGDGQIVSESELEFSVTVTDAVYHDIIPDVRLNGAPLTGVDRTYKAVLRDGDNSITVTAVNGAGSRAEAAFRVTYVASHVTAASEGADSVKEVLNRNLRYIVETVDNPKFGTGGGEWSILALARGNYSVPEGYYDTYYNNVVEIVQKKENKLDRNKWSEHSRLILGLTSIGKDVADVGGYNQLEKLADFKAVIKQGINGPIFALIALDSHNYEIPIVDGVAEQTTREKLIDYILDKEIKKGTDEAGGWALSTDDPDPDITAMALQALTPYYSKNEKVAAAAERAIDWLSRIQTSDGGYASWGTSNSESSAQVIVALTGMGIDPHTDARFVKNGHSVLDALLSFAVPDGGFMHEKSMPGANAMATDQGTYALVAYDRFVNGQKRLYDMTDVVIDRPESPKEVLNRNLQYTVEQNDNPAFGVIGGEWSILSLARGNYPVPEDYYDKYYNNVVKVVQERKNELDLYDPAKRTENSRLILALTSIGKDVADVGGYSQLERLADFNAVIKQGLNGPIFALLALDSHNYGIPSVDGVAEQTTREKLIDYILDKEIKKGTDDAGGWALFGSKPDPDITAMALQALASYYNKDEKVTAAVERAVDWLSRVQTSDGGFPGWGEASSESISQVIVALTGLGIDPHTDARFIKNGHSALDGLLSYALPVGGFMHVKSMPNANAMATEQGTYALVAYDRFVNGQQHLYDMTDVDIVSPKPEPEPGPGQIINVPNDSENYQFDVTAADSAKEITVNIPVEKTAKVSVNFPAGTPLPKLDAVKGNVSAQIPQGTTLVTGEASGLELLTTLNAADTGLKANISQLVPKGFKLDQIDRAFTMGGAAKVEFDQFVTLTFAGMKGKQAAYIEAGTPHAIQKVASDAEGMKSGKSEYAYDDGDRLVIKTKHFTDYVAYSTSAIETPGPGPGQGGGTNPPAKRHVTLSVDKLTINKGYVLPRTDVELQPGDTAWSLLKRELDKRGISYDFEWNEKYGSVYVQAIAGDGEFDHGSGSGWMYNVNGIYPGYGASSYTLSDGDKLEWRYTTNLGADLGEDNSKWEPLPGAGGTGGAAPVGPGIVIPPNDKTPVIQVPQDIRSEFVLKMTKDMQKKDRITIQIPKDVKAKVILDLSEVKDDIPQLAAIKGDLSFTIEKGTRLTSGKAQIELFTEAMTKQRVQDAIAGSLRNEKLDAVKHLFLVGSEGSAIRFDKPITVVIQGGKGQSPGWMEANRFAPIALYETANQGMQAVAGKDKQVYAYVQGRDLTIRTNELAAFVAYTVSQAKQAQPDDAAVRYADEGAISTWAVDPVREATEHGFIRGSNGKFHPKSNVTRAEFTKILVTALGIEGQAQQAASFTDVAADAWYSPYVHAAASAGLVTGYNDRFEPQANVTREQMASIISRALNLTPMKPASALKDTEAAAAWARADIETVAAHELMSGYNQRFRPKSFVTREMAAVVAVRVYDYQQRQLPENTKSEQAGGNAVTKQLQVNTQIEKTAAFLQKSITDPGVASVGGDWTVFGLARSGVRVPDAYYDKYYANVEKTVKEKSGKLHHVKYTEYDRVILALASIGKNVDNVAGYNLLAPLADFDTVIKQGINGPIFALIALDSRQYDIPAVQAGKMQTTRERLIEFILKRELNGGGWALGEKPAQADPDITAMALQGLAPYYETNASVKAAVDRGVAWLSAAQTADGGFASWESANSESVAQVIVALTRLGIDPHTDARFIKKGTSAVDALMSFAAPGGGFYHVKAGGTGNGGAKPGEVDLMATDQALYALAAYERFIKGHTHLYDLSDVK
ncbi:S-layer homology domain-containing protein [Paenibacillus thiaminolyticus]|uniref:S-layer homology domain-containing protein n=1 Tax=Paenibacillus thiaminolyticus TaxID=49283 RepID=UPI003D281775